MAQPSNEVKTRWMQKAYHKYTISLRYDQDQELIDYLEANKEKYGTTNIIRDALEQYVNAKHIYRFIVKDQDGNITFQTDKSSDLTKYLNESAAINETVYKLDPNTGEYVYDDMW